MIKLTLNTDTQSSVHSFDKEDIIIGNGPKADLLLDAPFIKDIHLRILKEEGRVLLLNACSDPFACVNGFPFGKKFLKDADLIDLHGYKIHVELSEEDIKESEEEESFDLEALLKEVENLEKAPVPAPALPEKNKEKKYYLHEFDDESEQWKEEARPASKAAVEEKGGLANHWRLLASLLFSVIALSTVICSGVYFRENGKNSQEEKKIAAGIADIAMALTHARLNHIVPDKQNWSDPEFLRNLLPRVIAPSLHPQAQIDSQGQFIDYPYRLRIYTSLGMDRFLVLAQPAPNLMQWIVHKKTLAIDSHSMELRKISDLKELNRLLSNPDPLENKNGDEIARVLREGTLMSLASLTGQKNHWGFTPPKALAFFRPGAENCIYNAPRYYPFGEDLLRRAVYIYNNDISLEETALLKDEIEEISLFNDIILYTSQGLQLAVEAQKALGSFCPNHKFLIAYVQFNPKGFVTSSHLLMNEGKEEIAFLDHKKNFATLLSKPAKTEVEEEDFDSGFDEEEEEQNDPILLEMNTLSQDRMHSLKTISSEMIDLLQRNDENYQSDFQEKFNKILETYLKTDQIHFSKISSEIKKLSLEHLEISSDQINEYAEKANLGNFLDKPEKIQEKIIEVNTLSALETFIQNMRDPHTVSSQVVERLNALLLSPESPYHSIKPTNEERSALLIILDLCIEDEGTKDYFLSEFDLIT